MAVAVRIDAENAAQGVLTLVVSLAEVIAEALEAQALRRMESGRLTDDEVERLGQALLDITAALERLKSEHGITDPVCQFREGLDRLVGDLVEDLLLPQAAARQLTLAKGGMAP